MNLKRQGKPQILNVMNYEEEIIINTADMGEKNR